jgi:starch phosphorylase
MVREYNEELYEPAAKGHDVLAAGGGKKALEIARWKEDIRKAWPQIHVDASTVKLAKTGNNVAVGEPVEVHATVTLGSISPSDVTVEAYYGKTVNNEITAPRTTPMKLVTKGKTEAGRYEYTGTIPSAESGSYGFSVRVIPTHPNLQQAHELRLITWAK